MILDVILLELTDEHPALRLDIHRVPSCPNRRSLHQAHTQKHADWRRHATHCNDRLANPNCFHRVRNWLASRHAIRITELQLEHPKRRNNVRSQQNAAKRTSGSLVDLASLGSVSPRTVDSLQGFRKKLRRHVHLGKLRWQFKTAMWSVNITAPQILDCAVINIETMLVE